MINCKNEKCNEKFHKIDIPYSGSLSNESYVKKDGYCSVKCFMQSDEAQKINDKLNSFLSFLSQGPGRRQLDDVLDIIAYDDFWTEQFLNKVGRR